jgi:ComF family protein
VAKFAGAALGSLFAAVFPSDCRFCHAPLANLSRLPACDQCLAKITPFDVPCCHLCGDPLAPDSEFLTVEVCANCYIERPLFTRAVSHGAYADELRELIHLLKYHQVRPAASVLGRMLAQAAEALLAGFESQPILVVPVPLHASKFRERGFNQSELIARSAIRELGRLAGGGSATKLELLTTVLLRRRATESQVGMTRDERRENIRGAFAVAGKEQVAGREVLLVDDVMTTGATVSECSRVLLGAGVKAVFVATVARALNESSLFASSREGAKELRE